MKTRSLLSLLSILLISLCSEAQIITEAWAKTVGGTGNDVATSVVVDHHGGVYIAGTSRSSSFTIGASTFTNAGGNDIFVAKYDTAGNFIWAQRFGGSGNESVRRMALAQDGSIYITDTFSTAITIDTYNFTAPGVYIAKLDNNGVVQWAKKVSGLNPDVGTDSRNNVYLSVEGSVIKYDKDGNLKFTITVGTGGYFAGSILPHISVDRLDNFHLSFYHGTTYQTHNWYDSNGVLLGAQPITGEQRFYGMGIKARYPNEFYHSGEFRTLNGQTTLRFGGNTTAVDEILGCTKTIVNTDVDHLGNQFTGGSIQYVGAPSVECNGGSYKLWLYPSQGISTVNGVDIFYAVRQGTQGQGQFLGTTRNNGFTNEQAYRIAIDTSAASLYIAGSWSKQNDTSKFYFGNTMLTNFGNGVTSDGLLLKLRFPINNTLHVNAGADVVSCAGGSKNLSAVVSGGPSPYTYSWSPAAGLNDANIQNPIATPAVTTDYVVTVTDNAGNIAKDTIRVTIDSNLYKPTISIFAGTNPFCENSGSGLQLQSSSGIAFSWSNGSTGSTTWLSQSDTVTVTTTRSDGCVGTSLPYIAVSLPQPDTPSIAASSLILCPGSSITLTAVTSVSPVSYIWYQGSYTTQSITVTTPGIYNMSVVDSNGCVSINATVNIIQHPLITGNATAGGATTFCSGDSVQLTVNTVPFGNVLWNTGETTNSIWVKTSGNYYATMSHVQYCSDVTNTISVTVNPAPSLPTIGTNGPTTFCSSGSVTLTAQNSETGLNYLWSTGATTSSIVVNSSGTYSVTATNSNGCVSPSASVTVTANPIPTGSIAATGNTNFCQGDSVQLNVTTDPANTILWNNGNTSNSIWVKSSGSYSATITSPQGCVITTNAITVTVNPTPLTPAVNASGPLTFCEGNVVTLSAQSSQAGVSYLWNTGATTNSIPVTTSGIYSVKAVSGACSSALASVTVTVNPKPAATITAGGPTGICVGDSVQLMINTTPGNSYNWSNGATTQSIWIKNSGNFYALVTSPQGCTTTTNGIGVVVNPIPVPVISQTGNVLTVTPFANTYQWFYNGNAIAGATTNTLAISQGGLYSVTVSYNGCTGTANWSAILQNGINGFYYQVYPNPTNQDISVMYFLPDSRKVSIHLFNAIGQKIATVVNSEQQQAGNHYYKLKRGLLFLTAGYYLVAIDAGDVKAEQKVIVF